MHTSWMCEFVLPCPHSEKTSQYVKKRGEYVLWWKCKRVRVQKLHLKHLTFFPRMIACIKSLILQQHYSHSPCTYQRGFRLKRHMMWLTSMYVHHTLCIMWQCLQGWVVVSLAKIDGLRLPPNTTLASITQTNPYLLLGLPTYPTRLLSRAPCL